MSMKAIMFAALGLFISMVATTLWINSDIQEIRREEAAKKQAKCASMAASPNPTSAAPAIDPYTGAPVAPSTPSAPAGVDDCAKSMPAVPAVPGNSAAPTLDPNAQVSPSTYPAQDPAAGAQQAGAPPQDLVGF